MSGELALHDAAAYAAQLRQLLPPGPVWRAPAGGGLSGLLLGLAVELSRIDARALDLIEEMDPRTAEELLAAWEGAAGLPDACTGLGETASERQSALVQKVTAMGSQSRAALIEIAQRLGYLIEIEEHRPAAIGMTCDALLYGDDWAFAWTVHVLPFDGYLQGRLPIAVAEVGDPVGIPLRGWGAIDLECVMSRARPAHTTVLFVYETEPVPALWFDFTR